MEQQGGVRRSRLWDLVVVGSVVCLSSTAVATVGLLSGAAFDGRVESEAAFFSLAIAAGVLSCASSILTSVVHRKSCRPEDTATHFLACDQNPLLAIALSACLTGIGSLVLILALIALAVVAGQSRHKGLLIFSVFGMALMAIVIGCMLDVAFQALWIRADGSFLRGNGRSAKHIAESTQTNTSFSPSSTRRLSKSASFKTERRPSEWFTTANGSEELNFQPRSTLEF